MTSDLLTATHLHTEEKMSWKMKPRCMSNKNHKNLKTDKANNNKFYDYKMLMKFQDKKM